MVSVAIRMNPISAMTSSAGSGKRRPTGAARTSSLDRDACARPVPFSAASATVCAPPSLFGEEFEVKVMSFFLMAGAGRALVRGAAGCLDSSQHLFSTVGESLLVGALAGTPTVPRT